jgi:hypothetical protein
MMTIDFEKEPSHLLDVWLDFTVHMFDTSRGGLA